MRFKKPNIINEVFNTEKQLKKNNYINNKNLSKIENLCQKLKQTKSPKAVTKLTKQISNLDRAINQKTRKIKLLQKKKNTLNLDIKTLETLDKKSLLNLLQMQKDINTELKNTDDILKLYKNLPISFDEENFIKDQIKKYDLFISHASEDKIDFVKPLAEQLDMLGVKVWYDEFALEIGDSLRKSIDEGLSNSKYGLVILSSHFFNKNWTQYELNGLNAKEMSGKKTILPIWHKVTLDEVRKYSPTLSDKIALNSSLLSIESIASKIRYAICKSSNNSI